MKKFIVTYHASMDAVKQMATGTPDEQTYGKEGWMQWAASSWMECSQY